MILVIPSHTATILWGEYSSWFEPAPRQRPQNQSLVAAEKKGACLSVECSCWWWAQWPTHIFHSHRLDSSFIGQNQTVPRKLGNSLEPHLSPLAKNLVIMLGISLPFPLPTPRLYKYSNHCYESTQEDLLCYIFWSEVALETDIYKYNFTIFSSPVSPLSLVKMESWGKKKNLTCILEILLNMCSLYEGRLNNWESTDLKNA